MIYIIYKMVSSTDSIACKDSINIPQKGTFNVIFTLRLRFECVKPIYFFYFCNIKFTNCVARGKTNGLHSPHCRYQTPTEPVRKE